MPRCIIPTGDRSVRLVEAPPAAPVKSGVRCRALCSLVSPGTERHQIENAEGKSDAEIAASGVKLGYCGAGVVEEVFGTGTGLKPGDTVAYYGSPYVSHTSELIVPGSLVRKVPGGLPAEQAAFIGLAAIALHGVRQTRPAIGDKVLVTGLGVIGNFCAQLAALSGCRVIATDRHPGRVALLEKCTAPGLPNLRAVPYESFGQVAGEAGKGTAGNDAAIVCVSSDSSEPIRELLPLLRPGSRIVAAGLLELSFPRDDFFAKEFEFTVSRAAGPGRYDSSYEADGVDYPVQYVRWTESHNLAEVLSLLAEGRLLAEPMVSAVYPIGRIADAYRAVFDDPSQTGIILDWNTKP